LRARWLKLYGAPAPKFFRRGLLVRAVAYQMQVKVYGGLSPATKRRLHEIAEAVRNGKEDDLLSGPRIKPGAQLLRVWRDETHRVTVLPDGFEWCGPLARDDRCVGDIEVESKSAESRSFLDVPGER
jgi:hypothetical protein